MADKKSPEQGETRKELEALLDKLDEESLQFLKQQAEILIYSGELEEARKKAAEAARNINRVQKQRRRDSRTDAEAAQDAETGKAGSDERTGCAGRRGARPARAAGQHHPQKRDLVPHHRDRHAGLFQPAGDARAHAHSARRGRCRRRGEAAAPLARAGEKRLSQRHRHRARGRPAACRAVVGDRVDLQSRLIERRQPSPFAEDPEAGPDQGCDPVAAGGRISYDGDNFFEPGPSMSNGVVA